MYNTLTSNTSALVGATGGNRLSRYCHYNDKNLKKFDTNDKIAIGIGAVVPATLSYMLRQSLQSSVLSYGVTSFAIAASLSHFLHKGDVDKANTQFPNKEKDIKEAQDMVDDIFKTSNPYSYIPSIRDEFKEATLRQKEFNKQIAENLYLIFSSSPEDTKKSQAIANMHKADIANMQKIYKMAIDIFNKTDRAGDINGHSRKLSSANISVVFEAYKKASPVIDKAIDDLERTQTRPDNTTHLLQKPIKKIASDLEKRITNEYKLGIVNHIDDIFEYCASYDFYYSKTKAELRSNIKRFNIDELNDLMTSYHKDALWYSQITEGHTTQEEIGYELIKVTVNLPDDKKAEVKQKIPFMSESSINSERNSLEKAKKLFRQALREKLLPDEPSPFIASREREKLVEQHTQSDKSFPNFTDTEKSLVALDYHIIKGFGSKEKAIEVRDDILTIDTQQDYFPNKQFASWGLGYEFTRESTKKEFTTKRDKKIVKKYAIKYHPDKTKDDGKTMAFITGLKAVDLKLAKKYWELSPQDRE
jgi:hypothetical protein